MMTARSKALVLSVSLAVASPSAMAPVAAQAPAPTTAPAAAQTSAQTGALAAQAEASIRASYAAWSRGDIDALLDDGWTLGFGFRSRVPRGTASPDPAAAADILRRFFSSLEYYKVSLEEIHVTVHGDTVVAWGFHTEDFKHRDKDPEFVRVRFSRTMMRQPDGRLRTVLTHRDIQPFGADGWYLPVKKK